MILSSSVQVVCAHCTYTADIAESCTHVRDFLFKIVVTVRICGAKTVTDFPAYWMIPTSVDKLQVEVGYKINFSSGAAKKNVLNKCISGERKLSELQSHGSCTCLCGHKPTLSDPSTLLQILYTHSKAVCLSGMEDLHHHYADPVRSFVVPESLLHLCDLGKDGCELSVLHQHCEGLTQVVAVTETQAAMVEAQMRQGH